MVSVARRHAGALRVIARRLAVCVWAGTLATPASAQMLSATLERNPIYADETVRLVVEIDAEAAGQSPDLRSLTSDFVVRGTSTSTHIGIVDGRRTAKTRWFIELEPRRSGELVVAPVAIGGRATPPVTLTVLPPREPSGEEAREIFVEVEADPGRPYVQAQLIYTIRLYLGVDVIEGSLSEPEVDNAVIERLGRDSGYEAMRGGRRYRVVERRYAIFPPTSGEMVIPPIRFQGRLSDGGSRMLDGLFDQGRPVGVRSRELRIPVRPRPAAFTGAHWLPAQELTLSEDWGAPASELRVGEPLTRTLRLEAKGLGGTQLPELEMAAPDGIRTYPDQAQASSQVTPQGVVGTRGRRIALLAGRAGGVTLPAIAVPWWDVDEERQKIASLPARTLTAVPAPVTADGLAHGERSGVWQGVSTALAIAWLVTVLGWWHSARRRHGVAEGEAPPPKRARPRAALERACAQGDAAAATAALLAWGASRWPESPPRSLGALAARSADTVFAAELALLDRALYAMQGDGWRSPGLAQLADAVLRAPHRGGSRAPHESLPPLRPQRG